MALTCGFHEHQNTSNQGNVTTDFTDFTDKKDRFPFRDICGIGGQNEDFPGIDTVCMESTLVKHEGRKIATSLGGE
jgi:hypothetical protein